MDSATKIAWCQPTGKEAKGARLIQIGVLRLGQSVDGAMVGSTVDSPWAWDEEDVEHWLSSLDFKVAASVMKEGHVAGPDLLQMEKKDLMVLFCKNVPVATDLWPALKNLRTFSGNAPPAVGARRSIASSSGRPGSESMPVEFRCPITLVVMTDPVVAADGYDSFCCIRSIVSP